MNPSDLAIIEFIKNWGAVVGIGFSIGIQWKTFKDMGIQIQQLDNRLSALEDCEQTYRPYKAMGDENRGRIEKLECSNQKNEISLAKIETKLVSIETTLCEIKQGQLEIHKELQK